MKQIILVLIAVLVLALPASAQTYLTSTTLAAAVTSTSSTTIRVTSATGFSVGYIAWVDNEAMTINAVNGTVISVSRGALGTRGATHANARTIVVGPPQAFVANDLIGSCTASNYPYLPLINVQSGIAWLCRSSAWQGTTLYNVTFNSLTLTP